jgi:hypothetical protein
VTHAKEGDVENAEVESHGERDRRDEVRVGPERQNQEGFVLAQRVAGVEHLDDWQKAIG